MKHLSLAAIVAFALLFGVATGWVARGQADAEGPDASPSRVATEARAEERLRDCVSRLERTTRDREACALPEANPDLTREPGEPWPAGLDPRFLPDAVQGDLDALLNEAQALELVDIQCDTYPCMVALYEANRPDLTPQETMRTIRDFLAGTHSSRVDLGDGVLYTLVVSDVDTALAGTDLASTTSSRFDAFGSATLRSQVGLP